MIGNEALFFGGQVHYIRESIHWFLRNNQKYLRKKDTALSREDKWAHVWCAIVRSDRSPVHTGCS